MKISKRDALNWYRFFTYLPEEEELLPRQQELALDVLTQIETAAEALFEEKKRLIPRLKSFRGRTLYVGPDEKFAGGCASCLTGTGLCAIRKTNRCNAACPFCYDYGCLSDQPPIGEGYWEIGGSRYREEDIPVLIDIQGKPSGVAYVYLEPFMEIEKYYGIIRRFRDAGVYQHLYTNGISATEDELKRLGEAGLDEIRFNLGASNSSDRVIEKLAVAKKYIKKVGIETPMTPAFFSALKEKRDLILSTGVDFINCAELHLNPNNLPNYMGENMYMSRRGYLSPISSRLLTLDAMRLADEENWPVVLHDCSNRTKFMRELNLASREGGWFGKSRYGSEFDRIPFEAFLPVLEDDAFRFVEEEPLPEGYRPGDIVL